MSAVINLTPQTTMSKRIQGGGATIPGGVQETTGCGTYCSGLVGKVVISQIFPNQNDSVILHLKCLLLHKDASCSFRTA